MKIGQQGLNLIMSFEGCHLTAYKCPADVWTIGYGHTKNVYPGMIITQVQAEQFLREDVAGAEARVRKYDSKYHWNQNEFDALVSFAYNIGSIDQLTAKGTRDRKTIADKILQYNKASGKILKGLVKRREAERELFLQSDSKKNITIKFGSKGNDVVKLQSLLSALDYDCGKIDGDFGNKTLSAVRQFQAVNNLKVDGVVGGATWTKLGSNPVKNPIVEYSVKKDGNKQISANFKVKEFACNDGSDKVLIDADFVKNYLQKIRQHFNAPVTINSAYRTEAYNKKVGGSANSYHVKGQAFDIVVKGKTPYEVAKYAYLIGINGIIRYNTFVHVDSRPIKYRAINDNGRVTTVSKF